MSILDLVFPKTCLGCGREGKYLCSDCITKALSAKLLCPNYVLSTVYSVLIFDDVVTTGSTLREACNTLKRAGVQKVWGLTIAR